MVQQWLSATAELGAVKGPQPHHATASRATATSSTLPETQKERVAATLDPAKVVVDEQHHYVEKLERALQVMASESPEPQAEAANRPNETAESAPPVDSRQLLDEQQVDVHAREGSGLESALQTLAKMPRPRLMPFGNAAPPPAEPGPQKAEDAPKEQPRKLGVIRVA